MKTAAKLFKLIIWSTLTLSGFDLHAAREPLYEGLGSYSRKITTDSPEAQRYFNQGLAFVHGFNHKAAIRAFQQAAELDPKRREALLHRIQQLMHERVMFAPVMEPAFLNGYGPRVAESGLGLISVHAYSAPYEDLRLRKK